jgi:hypothetical protein
MLAFCSLIDGATGAHASPRAGAVGIVKKVDRNDSTIIARLFSVAVAPARAWQGGASSSIMGAIFTTTKNVGASRRRKGREADE